MYIVFLLCFVSSYFCQELILVLRAPWLPQSNDKGKRPWEFVHLGQKWKEEHGAGRARPKNPAFEGPTKARRIFSHDLQGPTLHVLDLNSMPVIKEGMLVTDEFCAQYRALKREVEMLQEENIRLRRMLEYFINPRLLPLPPKE
jgi:hypothetical protein